MRTNSFSLLLAVESRRAPFAMMRSLDFVHVFYLVTIGRATLTFKCEFIVFFVAVILCFGPRVFILAMYCSPSNALAF